MFKLSGLFRYYVIAGRNKFKVHIKVGNTRPWVKEVAKKLRYRIPKYLYMSQHIDEERLREAGWEKVGDYTWKLEKRIVPTKFIYKGKAYRLPDKHNFFVEGIEVNVASISAKAISHRHPNVSFSGSICFGEAILNTTNGILALESQLRTINLSSCYWTPQELVNLAKKLEREGENA